MSEIGFSRNYACRVSDAFKYRDLQLLVLENELIRVEIFPQKGAEIYSIQYKPLDIDPLLHYRPLQTPSTYPATIPISDGTFSDVYDGGWQVMFPNGGGPSSAMGADFGRHGEAALLNWDWQILEDQPERVSVRFYTRMVRTPFALERVLSLESGKAELHFKEKVVNLGGEKLPFMWGHHPAFGAPFLDGSCVLDAPAKFVESIEFDLPCSRVPSGVKEPWHIIQGKDQKPLDLRSIPEDGGHTFDMLYLTGLEEGWYALTNRNKGLGFGLTWDVKVFPVLWVWQEFGGSKGHPWYSNTYALGLEPCTSYTTSGGGGLAEYIKTDQVRWLLPGEQLSTELHAVLYETNGEKGVQRISPDGKVRFLK